MRKKKFIYSTFLRKVWAGTVSALLLCTGTAYSNPENKFDSNTSEIALVTQQQKTVKGIITDESGEPVIGANVTEKGSSSVGTISDINGAFQLNVSANAVLEVSFIGYTTQLIRTGNQTSFNIQLEEDSQTIDEVVVVGYGVQKKVNLTGSVSSVNFQDQALSRPVTNVSSALAGLSSGVQVMQSSSRPGSDGATIRVRGYGTLNDNDPLIIIDGMENSIDAVLPHDIESISILKDAASSAIYGSRAANGVVLITTKKGKGKVNVKYTGRYSYAQPTNLVELVSDYADYMELMNESLTNIGQTINFNQTTIDLWREKTQQPNAISEGNVAPNYVAYPNTDWQRTLFTRGNIQDHAVSASGSSDNSRFLFSIGYLDNEGLVENTGMRRYSLRSNLETDVNKWLTIGTKIYATQENRDPGDFSNANNYLRQTTPGIYPQWEGKYGAPEAAEESATANGLFSFLNQTAGDLLRSRFNATAYSTVKVLKGLAWDFNFNYRRYWNEESTWTNAAAIEKVKFSTGTVMAPPANPAIIETAFNNSAYHSYTLENLLKYATTLNKVHDLSVLAGYQEYYYYRYSNSGRKRGVIDASATVPDAATEMMAIGGNAYDQATRSFFGRINYGYDSRYLLEANLRYDGTSRYHKDHRWGTFPSVSGAWRISEEAFMEGTRDVLNNLKVRVSWGQLGNTGGDDVSNYEYQSVYAAKNYPINSVLVPGLAVSTIANSLLEWESTTLSNVGLDITLLNNRLNIELDLYDKLTDGILYKPNINPIAGTVSGPRMNIAKVNNRGFETTIGWRDKIKDFSYAISGNFAYNKNEVTKYKGTYEAGWVEDESGNRTWISNLGDVSTGTINRVVEGKTINDFYLKTPYKGDGTYFDAEGTVNPNGGPKDGMIRTEEDMEWLKAMIKNGAIFYPNGTAPANAISKTKIWYGDYIYADNNGDNVYGSSNDEFFQGISNRPKYNFGMQASASWKGFDFSMNWAGATGFKLYWAPATGSNASALRVGLAVPMEIANNHYFYDPDNLEDPRTNLTAKYPRLVNGETGYQLHTSSTLYLHDGNYLKLKNLTVGYTIPKQIVKRYLLTEDIRLYVSGENLLTITSFPGQDPEMGATPGYTSMRQFAFGVNVTF
ncbi:TonB-dependent receptor SusC [termite gut metagenome]|uniref:TonB-dependent receptor SusC n=1 Tax=termite gut metagenome TaxID=433724 RepID=A0A5J4SE41_9ZZZZ